ncbi:MAG: PepSY-associated TM helix domain-containing protein [Thermoguttaceae bacterium]
MKLAKEFARSFHRYLGWGAGIVFLFFCLTGSLFLIKPEIERIAEPSRYVTPAHPGEELLTPDAFIKNFESIESSSFSVPTTIRVLELKTSKDTRRAWSVLVSAKNDKESWVYMATADPYTGEALSYGPGKLSNFFTTLRSWHDSLGLTGEKKKTGRTIVGYLGLAIAVVLLSGLIMWIPSQWSNKKALANSFLPVVSKGARRAFFSLHNVLGFYSTLALLCITLSGVWICLPWFQKTVDCALCVETKDSAQPQGPSQQLVACSCSDCKGECKGNCACQEKGKGQGQGLGKGQGQGQGLGKGQGQGQGLGKGHGQGIGMGAGNGAGHGMGNGKAVDPAYPDSTYGLGIRAARSPRNTGVKPKIVAMLNAPTPFRSGDKGDALAVLGDVISAQNRTTPKFAGYDIVLPEAGSDNALSIREYDPICGSHDADVYYWDVSSGELLGVKSPSDKPCGERIRGLIKPFHMALLGGAIWRYILLLFTLIGVTLSVTGYVIMTNRLSAKNVKK